MDDLGEGLGPAIERAIEAAIGGRARLSGVPVPLAGGFSARLHSFRLDDGPKALPDELVLRIPPPGSNVRRESIIQGEVARSGYPAPAVLMMSDDAANPLGSPYLVMAKAPGVPLFVDAAPIAVVGAFRRAPRLFARLMADLHDLETTQIVQALSAGGVRPDQLGEDCLLEELRRVFDATSAPALGSILSWLGTNRPIATQPVVCHGDLHALNILEDAPRYTVVDWELATIGHPALDVARTSLLLSAVPVEMSARARGMVQRLGRRSAARFREAYAERRPLDPQAFSWYEALHAGRILARLMQRAVEAERAADPVLDAWSPTAPYLTTRLREITGIDVAA